MALVAARFVAAWTAPTGFPRCCDGQHTLSVWGLVRPPTSSARAATFSLESARGAQSSDNAAPPLPPHTHSPAGADVTVAAHAMALMVFGAEHDDVAGELSRWG